MVRSLAGVAAIALLAACSGQESKAPEPTPNPPVAETSEAVAVDPALASCAADKLRAYIDTMMSDEALARIKATSGAKTVRVVGPRDMMTMDFRQDRLTIATTEDGRIKSLRCV